MDCAFTVTGGPMPAWSKKQTGDANGLFIPMTAYISTNKVGSVRVSVERRSNSGDAAVRVAYQVADEQSAPGTVYSIGCIMTL